MTATWVQWVEAANNTVPQTIGNPFTPNQPPAPLMVQIATTTGNTLVVYAGLDVSFNATSAPVPSFNVTDSAGNLWIPVTLSPTSQPAARATIWVAFNALAVSWVSITPNGYCSTDVAFVSEFSGISAFPQIDFVSVPQTSTSTTLTLTGTASQSDYVFGMLAIGSTGYGTLTPPAALTQLATGNTGSTFPNGLGWSIVWGSVTAGAVSATWTIGSASPMAGVLIGLSQANFPPAQTNPNFPAVKVEMAFGASPGDPTANVGIYGTGALPSSGWTDVTSRCIGHAGSMAISGIRGRTYELSQPEAGTCDIGLRNDDGAFNPTNTSSPYYPNVTLNTPVRITALWSGRRYPVYVGYISKWPQDWPDLPQFGLARAQAVDICGVASNTNMPSAVQGEILADAPYFCLPFSEQYTVTAQAPSNQVGTVKVASECDGFLAVNTSRVNQRPATYKDGGGSIAVVTGQSMGLLGDAGTGMGATGYGLVPSAAFRGPGAVYADSSNTVTLSGPGSSLEFFFNVPAFTYNPVGNLVVQILSVEGPPVITSPTVPLYTGANQILNVSVQQTSSGVYSLIVNAGTVGGAYAILGTTSFAPYVGVTNHLVVTMTSTGFACYLNGSLLNSTSATTLTDPPVAWAFGCAALPYTFAPANGDYTLSYGTGYTYQLPAARIAAHATAGFTGFAGDSTIQRFGRYMAWTGVNMSPAAWPQVNTTYQVNLGAAYQTANSSLSDAMNQMCLADGGMWFSNAAGSLVFATRQSLYNNASSVTFGDSNSPGEVPYLPSIGLDYDNTYLYNVVQATQTNGPNTLLAPIEKSATSIAQYQQRGTLQQSVNVTSAQDVYDRAYWSLNKFQQPSMRIRALTVDAASNPAVAFTPCLRTDIGDIATVNRRPVGASANYSLPVLIQQVGFKIGPSVFQFMYVGTPYTPEGHVLTTDNAANDVLGTNALAW